MWILSLIPSCHREGEVGLSQNDQVGIDSVVSACPDIDSLQSCLRYFERTANELGVILAYKELEVRYREAARFNEAIGCHREGLRLAMQRKDTSEVIQALNNIGTNFRRLGIMDEAPIIIIGHCRCARDWVIRKAIKQEKTGPFP